MSLKPTSILKLTLLGFILVAVPLTFGLLSTLFQVDRLAVKMQTAVHGSTQAVESGHLIVAQALSMERSSRQYLVLQDEAILSRYQTQRIQLAQEIEQLLTLQLSSDLFERLHLLMAWERDLYNILLKAATQSPQIEQKLAAADRFSELVRPIPFYVTRMIAHESGAMNHQISQVQRLLLWQAVALIPLALLIAIIFSVLISRPLRHLGTAIRQLGAGKFSTAIEVAGPQDIRELGEQLDWLRRQLAALDEQKLQFLHHVSHELKTPLASIRQGAELLRDGITGDLKKEQQEVVQILHQNSLQLQNQVESLLNFNLALTQKHLPSRESVDLATLIPASVKKQQLALRSRNISIDTKLQSTKVNGAPEQLQAIIDNLFSNAIRYSCNGGKVQIRVYQEKQMAIVDIIDEGVGILPEERLYIFKPFFQGKTPSKGSLQGTGLGLSIVEHYLRLHGGFIKLVETQQGTHFRVTLPVVTMQILNTRNKTDPN